MVVADMAKLDSEERLNNQPLFQRRSQIFPRAIDTLSYFCYVSDHST